MRNVSLGVIAFLAGFILSFSSAHVAAGMKGSNDLYFPSVIIFSLAILINTFIFCSVIYHVTSNIWARFFEIPRKNIDIPNLIRVLLLSITIAGLILIYFT